MAADTIPFVPLEERIYGALVAYVGDSNGVRCLMRLALPAFESAPLSNWSALMRGQEVRDRIERCFCNPEEVESVIDRVTELLEDRGPVDRAKTLFATYLYACREAPSHSVAY